MTTNYDNESIKDLIGNTIKSYYCVDDYYSHIDFTDGTRLVMYHQNECCESIEIESFDIEPLIGKTITDIDYTLVEIPTEYGGSTRTSLILETLDNKITLSWLGESNGYYSEQVNYRIYPILDNKDVHQVLANCLTSIASNTLEINYKPFHYTKEIITYYLTFKIEDLIRKFNIYIKQRPLEQLLNSWQDNGDYVRLLLTLNRLNKTDKFTDEAFAKLFV
jgi:hypothetical protein